MNLEGVRPGGPRLAGELHGAWQWLTLTSVFFGHHFDFATHAKHVVDAHHRDADEKQGHEVADERSPNA